MGQRLDRSQTPVSSLFKYDSSTSSGGAGASNTNQNSSSTTTATAQLNSNAGGASGGTGGASGGGGGGGGTSSSSNHNHRSSSNRHNLNRASSNDYIHNNYHENNAARPNDAFLRFLQYRGRHQTNSSSNSDDDDGQTYNPFEHAIPILMGFRRDLKCLVCHKLIPSDEIETHLAMCLTKPRVTYNDDVLAEDKDEECIICFENLEKGQTIARLPCLCIYHKHCIDSWFKKNQSCPAHPSD